MAWRNYVEFNGLQRQALSVVPLSIVSGGVILSLLLRPLGEGARRTPDLTIIPFHHTDPWIGQGQFDWCRPHFGCPFARAQALRLNGHALPRSSASHCQSLYE